MFAGHPTSSSPLAPNAAAVAAVAASTHSSFQLQISNSNGNLASKLHGSAAHDVITAAAGNSGTTTGGGNGAVKRKRRPAGTPDPDAEVVSLSPRTLLESDRYVCEICNQGFQRDQNLQMHRRRHKVPWKLLKREDGSGAGAGGPSSGSASAKKRVFVCPEPTCLHHDPLHALGDLVGIKKHFRRKHSAHRQWACARCGKAYAVHSDYKAHLKTCGTRGHSCDCGRVFSRVESFIEHQDACHAGRARGPDLQHAPPPVVLPLQQQAASLAAATVVPACLSRTASSPSPSSDTNFSPAANPSWPSLHRMPPAITVSTPPAAIAAALLQRHDSVRSPQTPMMPDSCNMSSSHHRLELQLLPGPVAGTAATSSPLATTPSPRSEEAAAVTTDRDTELLLTIGTRDPQQASRSEEVVTNSGSLSPLLPVAAAARLKDDAKEQLRAAEAEKAAADEVRAQARYQIEMAERELANARRVRQQAQQELARAQLLRDHAVRQVNATLLQITCQACKHHFMAAAATAGGGDVGDMNSLGAGACSYASASVVTEGEGDNVDVVHRRSTGRAHHAAAPATAARFAKT